MSNLHVLLRAFYLNNTTIVNPAAIIVPLAPCRPGGIHAVIKLFARIRKPSFVI